MYHTKPIFLMYDTLTSKLSDCNCRFCPIPPIVKISNPLSL